MSDNAWTAGPYSVHPYSKIQERKWSKDGSYEHAAITIGAGNKMLGEVSFLSVSHGYPRIETEEEMNAVAALWIAAPEMAKAVLSVVAATRAFLPPDGIDAQECINRILEATDNSEINPIIRMLENGRP